MRSIPYAKLVRYKQWADRGLYEVVRQHIDRLSPQDADILRRILDHIYVVDRIFQHHLQGLPHEYRAPRSSEMPDIAKLAQDVEQMDNWYVSYVWEQSSLALEQPVDFVFTDGTPARMTRGEIILHVCLHGTYHRGNAGLILQKNNIAPNQDRMTDFLSEAA